MPREKVYLETSVISYLTSRPSRDVVTLAKQELTREWWRTSRQCFDVYVSQPVMDEIKAGDPDAARERLDAVESIPVLSVNENITALYEYLLSARLVPHGAATDAFHIATAAYYGIPYLLTWNFKHINNAATKRKIADAVRNAGYAEAVTVTPEELWR